MLNKIKNSEVPFRNRLTLEKDKYILNWLQVSELTKVINISNFHR